MKKFFAIILCFCMVLSLVACGASEETPEIENTDTEDVITEDATTDEVPAVDLTGDTVGVANPWTPYDTVEELNNVVLGALSLPTSVETSDTYFASCGVSDYTVGECQFYMDGMKCVERFAAPYDVDISGIYSAGVLAMGSDVEMETPKLFEDVGCLSIKWATIDGQYVFTVFDESVSEETFLSVYQELYTYSFDNSYAHNGD